MKKITKAEAVKKNGGRKRPGRAMFGDVNLK